MRKLTLALALAALAGIAGASAQTYPSRPVTIIVPYPAGGPTDLVARQLAPKLSAKFGQNFIIENVSGGGTNIAGQRVARSAPEPSIDDETWAIGVESLANWQAGFGDNPTSLAAERLVSTLQLAPHDLRYAFDTPVI